MTSNVTATEEGKNNFGERERERESAMLLSGSRADITVKYMNTTTGMFWISAL